MPVIPRAQPPQQTVQPTEQPLLRDVPEDSFGQAFSQAAGNILQMHEEVEAREALTNFQRQANTLFFDRDTGYFSKEGREAYDGRDAAANSVEKLREEISKGLGTAGARRAFDVESGKHVTRWVADIDRHAAKHLDVWHGEVSAAEQEIAIQNAAARWSDDKALNRYREIGLDAVERKLIIDGQDDSVIRKNRREEFISNFNASAIQAALAQSGRSGKSMFDKLSNEVRAPLREKLLNQINQKLQPERAIDVADNAVFFHGDKPNARHLVMEEIEGEPDDEVRKDALHHAMFKLDQMAKARDEKTQKVFEGFEGMVQQGASVEEMRRDRPDAWEELKPEQRKALASGKPIITDQVKLNELLSLPLDKLAEVRLAEHLHYLDESGREKLSNAITAANHRTPESQVGRTRARQATQAIVDIFGGKKESEWKRRHKKLANTLYNMIDFEVKAETDARGRPLTSTEYTKVIGDFTTKAYRDRMFEILPREEIGVSDILEEIPEPMRNDTVNEIQDFLRDNNIPFNANNFNAIWNQVKPQVDRQYEEYKRRK